MKHITDKDFKVWTEMADFIEWNFEGDYKNKVLEKVHSLVCLENAKKIKEVGE
tara:strand:- start:1271 stop:1429 length:159 start_codon:yes stop_codon:yes gene_type:complete